MTGSWRHRLLHLALWLPLLAYALQLTHRFFQYVDRGVTLSTDDGMANIAYALATEGTYGFLSSPVLFDMPRDHGLFSYGPFYFYAAAALVWLFGYSLTVVRAVHLAVILCAVAAARSWFGRTAGGAVGAIVGVGLLVAFERGQWPMVRPDSMVTFFAVLMVIASGLAIRSGRWWQWALAAFAAACGALTHLAAWSLVPAMAVILLVSIAASARAEDGTWRRPELPWAATAACAAGGLFGALLFYASFDFRFSDQLRFLTGYQEITGSIGAAAPGRSFAALLVEHFKLAYWYLPYPLAYVVWATLPISMAATGVFVLGLVPRRREHLALLAPPLIVWAGYLLSLGTYNNFHSGYTILNQVMWIWTFGALGAVTLEVSTIRPRVRRVLAVAAYVLALALTIGVLTFLAQRTGYRELAARAQVSIEEYSSHVLEAIPRGARSWGGVVFGIEHPGRIQLVQFGDAVPIVRTIAPEQRSSVSPDFLLWSYTELRDSVLSVLDGHGEPAQTLAEFFPDVRYQLVSLTAGAPYGVTRVYARSGHDLARQEPAVSVYDSRHRRWTTARAPAEPLPISPASPVTLFRSPDASAAGTAARQSLVGELPAGTYLLRISVLTDRVEGTHNVWIASPAAEVRDSFGEFGPQFDVSPRLAGEPAVHIVYQHPGGRVYISQFGEDSGSIAGVLASRLLPLPDYGAARRTAPEERPIRAMDWIHPNTLVGPDWPDQPGIRLSSRPGGEVLVEGNAIQYGYQAYGPEIPVEPFERVRIRLITKILAGTACIGILDGTGMAWLVVPDKLLSEYDFQVNDSSTVKLVLANCSSSPQGIVPIRAMIGAGSYTVFKSQEEPYVPMLMRLYREGLATGRAPLER